MLLFGIGLQPISANAAWVKVAAQNSFNDVALTKAEHNALVETTGSAPFWGYTGPSSVFLAWNSAAFDPQTQRMYFIGGGHADYGGNEVYMFDLLQNRWSRVSMPEPLTEIEAHSQMPEKVAFLPANSPLSTHSYDGISWNPKTRSFWLASAHGFGGSGMPTHQPKDSYMWEFSPEHSTWKKHKISYKARWPKTIAIGNTGNTLMVEFLDYSYHRALLVNEQGQEQIIGKVEGLQNASSIGNLFSNPITGKIYSAHLEGIFELTFQGNKLSAKKVASFPSLAELHLTMNYDQAGYAYRPRDGKFYIWNGDAHLLSWSPDTGIFEVIWHQSGEAPDNNNPGAGKVFDKFVYVESEDAFVAIMNGADGGGSNGVWKWLPETNDSHINQLNIGELQLDGRSQHAVSLFLPITAGDKNYNSRATLFYRIGEADEWLQGMDLFRLRPELTRNSKNKTGISAEGFAGMVTGLSDLTQYEFKVTLTDADGVVGDAEQFIVVKTKAKPDAGNSIRQLKVNNSTELTKALASAQPGDVIQLAPGIYSGSFTLNRSGTASRPITIRGALAAITTLDGTGHSKGLTIAASHVRVEHLTIQGASTGINFSGSRLNVALQNLWIKEVKVGIYAIGGQQELYIANNVLQGGVKPGDVSSATWNFEGIVVTGQDIEIAHNTLSGFGDSLGLHWNSLIPNKAIYIHHNKVLWGGDDGVEFDFALRNVSVSHNLLMNVANGLSFQPVWGGPVYATRNLVVNTGRGPLKIKPEQDNPNGIFILHNTFVRAKSDIQYGSSDAWSNSSGLIRLLYVKNNLFVSPVQTNYVLKNESKHDLTELSHNGWTAEGRFNFYMHNRSYTINAKNFAQWQSSEFGRHDQMLSSQHLFKDFPIDVNLHNFSQQVNDEKLDLSPADGSTAIDNALKIPGINNIYSGVAPDIGAVEQGDSPIFYGASLKLTPPDDNYPISDNARTDMNKSILINPLANDILIDAANVQLNLLKQPNSAEGKIELQAANNLLFTPANGFTGTVVLDYSLSPARGVVNTQTERPVAQITIRITPPNTPPKAGIDYFELLEGNDLVILIENLLKNDSDLDGGVLQITKIGQPSHGELIQNPSQLKYKAKVGYVGQDTFTYELHDGQGGIATGQVVLNVMSNRSIIGTALRDYIDMSKRADGFVIYGKGGPDIITGSAGNDTISGDEHEDRISSGPGDDLILYSGQDKDHDWVDGGVGFDEIRGDEGDTRIGLHEIKNIERINGGTGYDVISGTIWRQTFDFSKIKLLSIELIDGGEHGDIIIGSAADDHIKGSHGEDNLDGGLGIDTAVYDLPFASYQFVRRADALEVKALTGNEGTDLLKNFEFLQFKDKRVPFSDIR
jgi:Ca2+-binding RTX toxin-like protein